MFSKNILIGICYVFTAKSKLNVSCDIPTIYSLLVKSAYSITNKYYIAIVNITCS